MESGWASEAPCFFGKILKRRRMLRFLARPSGAPKGPETLGTFQAFDHLFGINEARAVGGCGEFWVFGDRVVLRWPNGGRKEQKKRILGSKEMA